MGAKWARTPEEDAYLDGMLLQYHDAQAENKGPLFIDRATEGWFLRWPESERIFGKPSPDNILQLCEERAQQQERVAVATAV